MDNNKLALVQCLVLSGRQSSLLFLIGLPVHKHDKYRRYRFCQWQCKNELTFTPFLWTYRLNWAKRTTWWGQSEAEHATCRTMEATHNTESFRVFEKNTIVGEKQRAPAWQACEVTTTQRSHPIFNSNWIDKKHFICVEPKYSERIAWLCRLWEQLTSLHNFSFLWT